MGQTKVGDGIVPCGVPALFLSVSTLLLIQRISQLSHPKAAASDTHSSPLLTTL